jgi:peptidoglycan/LPS O-acetylase OafA/YrhL
MLRRGLLAAAGVVFLLYPLGHSVWRYGDETPIGTTGLPLQFVGYVACAWLLVAAIRGVGGRLAGILMLVTLVVGYARINALSSPVSSTPASQGYLVLVVALLVILVGGPSMTGRSLRA